MTSLGFRKAAPASGAAGWLDLSVAAFDGVSCPVRTRHGGVLRLMRALYLDDSGQVTYVVINPGGAYFGEAYQLDVEVEPGASLLLASQGATRIYRTPREPAVQRAAFHVREGARLEYIPEQTIAYRDADYRQFTTITVAPDAQVFLGEVITPGWDPQGRRFTYAGLRLRLDVVTEQGRAVCTDNLGIRPAEMGASLDSVGHLEGASHMGSVLAVGPHTATEDYLDRAHAVVQESGLTRAGVTTGTRHGISWLMVRALADSTDALTALCHALNEVDRAATTGQARLHLRRY